MSVADRWHTRKPRKVPDPGSGEPVPVGPCREHSRGKTVLYPSTDHGQGDRWQVRYRDEAGRQKSANRPKKEGKDPETCAEALDAQIQTQLNTDSYVDPEAGRVTLRAYAAQWRKGLTTDLASQHVVDKHLVHILDLGDRQVRALSRSPSAIRQWISGLQAKGLGAGYIKAITSTLSTIFNAAIDDGACVRNPVKARSVKLPTMTKRLIVPWTREMVDDAADELQRRHKAAGMVYLGAGAGLREGEIWGIAEDDIVFLGRERVVKVRRQVKRLEATGDLIFALPKGGKERDVPLSDALGLRLAAQIKACPPVPVTLPWGAPDGKLVTAWLLFVRGGGLPWYRQAFEYSWRMAREAAGVTGEGNGPHVLRHTAASAWLAGGVDVRTLADWLGHEDPGFTLRTYTHLMPDAAGKGRRAMDEFLDSEVEEGQDRAQDQ